MNEQLILFLFYNYKSVFLKRDYETSKKKRWGETPAFLFVGKTVTLAKDTLNSLKSYMSGFAR